MSKPKYNLIVVAHPDDETIYFGGLILKQRRIPWRVICVTDGNADGKGAARKRHFRQACRQLGVADSEWWQFPDIFEKRLDQNRLVERLQALPSPVRVFTHGVLGEYGHPHHQDVSAAVHRGLSSQCPVFSVAYNCFPDLMIRLHRDHYDLKTRILSKVYGSETRRFANLLPATAVEGFTRVDPSEVEAIYRFYSERAVLRPRQLRTYRWFWDYLRAIEGHTADRLF